MKYRALLVAFLALCLGFLTACSEGPTVASGELTYNQIKNTGLAVNCPNIEGSGRGTIAIDPSQNYRITELCLQPTDYYVKEESNSRRREAEFVLGKLLTRRTFSIDQVSGSLNATSDKKLVFTEEDGMDFQAITVLLPGGEQVPFLFTIKKLVASAELAPEGINTSTDFEGDFIVPSYRSAGFLDPKGRGTATGYDNAVALPASADAEDYESANTKRTKVRQGHISLQVSKIDDYTGEIAGTFESEQPSDTDLGAQEPLDMKIEGRFYARVEPA